MTKKFLIAFAAVFLVSCNKACFGLVLTEDDVKEIIKEYIDANGQQLSVSIEKYMTKRQYEETEASLKSHSPLMGGEDAKVTLIEFSDYRCGYCRISQETMVKLREKYGQRVKFAFKHMPILSEESRNAAFASQAAHQQGKFWEFHNKLWENQSRLGEELYAEIAKDIGLDVDKFNEDRASEKVQAEVYKDYEDGQRFGASGTPFFMVNGEGLSGAQPVESFTQAIDAALAKAEAK